MANINNYIVNSDLPIQKIAYLEEITTVHDPDPPGGISVETTIPNPTGRPLLIQGVFTVDNWATSTPVQCQTIYGDNISLLRSTADQIAFFTNSQSAKTFKIRLWGFIREQATGGLAEETASESAQHLAFDSRNNYLKPAIEGTAIFQPRTEDTYIDIPHNLGFRPYVELWQTSRDGSYSSFITDRGIVGSFSDRIRIYNTVISTIETHYFYRIYANEI